MNGSHQLLDISWSTIVKLALTGFLVYVVFLIREILVWVLFGLIISVLFEPVISALQKKHIPRVLAAVFVYLCLFRFLSYVIFATAPIFIHEIQEFSHRLPQYFEERISPSLQGLGVATFQDFQSFVDAFATDASQNTANNFKVELAIAALKHCLRKLKDHPQKANVETILAEIQKSMHNRPYHAEFYLQTLRQTLDILLLLNGSNSYKDKAAGYDGYYGLSHFFKQKKSILTEQQANRVLLIGLSLLAIAVFIASCSEANGFTLAIQNLLSFAAGIFMLLQTQTRTAASIVDHMSQETTATPLSQAIENLLLYAVDMEMGKKPTAVPSSTIPSLSAGPSNS